MLTASQCVVVAFVSDGGIICRECATTKWGEMGVAAIEEGIAGFVPQDVSCLIEYELSEYVGELAAEYADEDNPEHLSDGWQAAYDSYPSEYPCDDCGKDCT